LRQLCYAKSYTGDNMGNNNTFIIDLKYFNTYRSSLESAMNDIKFLGVKTTSGFTKFINITHAKEIVVDTDHITIYFDDYYYVITEEGIEKKYYVKY
jgi:hypothetical protein